MGELRFIGLGVGDAREVPERSREAIATSAEVFAEEYTSPLEPGLLDGIAQELGRPIVRLTREELESGASLREALGRGGPVALLVGGDPFVATTHVALRLLAEGWGHRWSYRPGVSVLTAAPSLLGLMHYRFGRTVSIPFPAPGFAPRSPIERIDLNRRAGLHTLVLLDLGGPAARAMTAHEALRRLAELDDGTPRLLPEGTLLAIVARAGRPDQVAFAGTRAELALVDPGATPHCLVVPAPELHEIEAAALGRWRKRD